jgi:hypothetical protein
MLLVHVNGADHMIAMPLFPPKPTNARSWSASADISPGQLLRNHVYR